MKFLRTNRIHCMGKTAYTLQRYPLCETYVSFLISIISGRRTMVFDLVIILLLWNISLEVRSTILKSQCRI